jgi:hypothetical protein
LAQANDAISSLRNELAVAQAQVSDLERQKAELFERRVVECTAAWIVEAAAGADKRFRADLQAAKAHGLPVPNSCDILQAASQRLLKIAREIAWSPNGGLP